MPVSAPVLHRRRACIYRRISQDREGLEIGVGRQEEAGQLLADEHDLDVVAVFSDNDISASTRSNKRRPDFEAMLAGVAAGKYDVVIAYSNSRLTRQPLELERLIALHEKTSVQFMTVKSGTDDLSTADGRMIARIKASVDAAEAERTGERVLADVVRRRNDGELHGGTRVFGYVHPTKDNKVGYCREIDEQAARAIRDGAEIMLRGGKGAASEVMRLWNERGIRTPFGKPWTNPANVQRVLSRPRIAGYTSVGGKYLVRGDWPAIINLATHLALVEACKPRQKHRAKSRKYLLPGFIYCACGAPMVANVAPQYGLDRYLCRKQRGGCGSVSRSRAWVDAAVREYVRGKIETKYEPASQSPEPAVAVLEDEIRGFEAGIARLRQSVMNGVFTDAEVAEDVVAARAAISDRRAQQAALAKAAAVDTGNKAETLSAWMDTDTATLVDRQEILARYVKMIIVKPLDRQVAWGAERPLPPDCIEIVPV